MDKSPSKETISTKSGGKKDKDGKGGGGKKGQDAKAGKGGKGTSSGDNSPGPLDGRTALPPCLIMSSLVDVVRSGGPSQVRPSLSRLPLCTVCSANIDIHIARFQGYLWYHVWRESALAFGKVFCSSVNTRACDSCCVVVPRDVPIVGRSGLTHASSSKARGT